MGSASNGSPKYVNLYYKVSVSDLKSSLGLWHIITVYSFYIINWAPDVNVESLISAHLHVRARSASESSFIESKDGQRRMC